MKPHLEELTTIEEVNVVRSDKKTGYEWKISFTKATGNLNSIETHKKVFCVQAIDLIGGNPTPLGGFFSLIFAEDKTHALPYDVSSDELKVSLESLSSIHRVDVERVSFVNGQSNVGG